ncbi:hypothetical protein D7V80_11840 [Corallococcus sp. CA054B]|nr:hypothetical protein D7V80_11840 [Corallococcus sp. CA054B]
MVAEREFGGCHRRRQQEQQRSTDTSEWGQTMRAMDAAKARESQWFRRKDDGPTVDDRQIREVKATRRQGKPLVTFTDTAGELHRHTDVLEVRR